MSREEYNPESAVRDRYSAAAGAREAALCCPVNYNKEFLKIIPQEVIDRDYGCGDPSEYVRAGETVLDLGSGGGKICFIASQVVGAKGKVIGVDMNDDMLALARTSAPVVAAKTGFSNTEFRKGKIQDLRLDRDRVDAWLKENPVRDERDLVRLENFCAELATNEPMIADNTMDAVVSNCVLNLVSNADKRQLFQEIFRVLKRGGRAIISDIVSDEFVPEHLQNDPYLWSGCLSGAFQEAEFLKAFADVGFYGIEMVKRDVQPWQTVEGIEFRSVTVIAYKGKEGDCWDHKEALVYKGPFSSVTDDDGHTYPRGERVAVCRKTFEIFTREPYKQFFEPVKPLTEVTAAEARPFPCTGGVLMRHPKETKGEDYSLTSDLTAEACGPSGCC
jgi:ubiquinone/menaquinone biosynthesis C-methylase UbiE